MKCLHFRLTCSGKWKECVNCKPYTSNLINISCFGLLLLLKHWPFNRKLSANHNTFYLLSIGKHYDLVQTTHNMYLSWLDSVTSIECHRCIGFLHRAQPRHHCHWVIGLLEGSWSAEVLDYSAFKLKKNKQKIPN